MFKLFDDYVLEFSFFLRFFLSKIKRQKGLLKIHIQRKTYIHKTYIRDDVTTKLILIMVKTL